MLKKKFNRRHSSLNSKKLTIGILLEHIHPSAGGAFTVSSKLIEGLNHSHLNKKFNFLVIGHETFEKLLPAQIKLIRFPIKYSSLKWIFHILASYLNGNRSKVLGRQQLALNKLLKQNKIDLLWSPTPLRYQIYLPYINTVWDLGHLDFPFLPEFSSLLKDEFKFRETEMSLIIKRALINVVGTNSLKNKLINNYNVNADRIKVVGIPSKLEIDYLNENFEKVENLIIYPAQFWSHKNHMMLLQAITILNRNFKTNIQLKLIGSDKGSRARIEKHILESNLASQVEIIDFIERKELHNYYSKASILIFPSLLGPENLPPFEALQFRCKVMVANIEGAKEVYGDLVSYFNPLEPADIAIAIHDAIKRSPVDLSLIRHSKELNKTFRNVEDYLSDISDIILSLENQIVIAQNH